MANLPISDIAVLEPQWLANVMSSLVQPDSKLVDARILRCEDWHTVWQEYPRSILPTLVQLLVAFGVAYPVHGATEQRNVVPAMLSEHVPTGLDVAAFDTATRTPGSAARLRVQLRHISLHFFPRLHTRLQALMQPDLDSLWRTGGLFHADGHQALVWQPPQSDTIEVGLGVLCCSSSPTYNAC